MQKNTPIKPSAHTPAGGAPGAKPQEKYGLQFSSHLKITDKGSGKVILNKRCD